MLFPAWLETIVDVESFKAPSGTYLKLPSGKLTLLLKMAIEIVDLPSYTMVIFHSYVAVLPKGEFLRAFTDSRRISYRSTNGYCRDHLPP